MSESSLRFWYACRDCDTEWTAQFVEGKSFGCYQYDTPSDYECSYCRSYRTYFIGWEDEDEIS